MNRDEIRSQKIEITSDIKNIMTSMRSDIREVIDPLNSVKEIIEEMENIIEMINEKVIELEGELIILEELKEFEKD